MFHGTSDKLQEIGPWVKTKKSTIKVGPLIGCLRGTAKKRIVLVLRVFWGFKVSGRRGKDAKWRKNVETRINKWFWSDL